MIKTASFNNDIVYNDEKVAVKVIMETSVSKEIRIMFRKGQEMKKHKAPFPITVQVLKGEIDFGVNDEKFRLFEGDIIALDANIPHDLFANKESMVRLTLSRMDTIDRVINVIK